MDEKKSSEETESPNSPAKEQHPESQELPPVTTTPETTDTPPPETPTSAKQPEQASSSNAHDKEKESGKDRSDDTIAVVTEEDPEFHQEASKQFPYVPPTTPTRAELVGNSADDDSTSRCREKVGHQNRDKDHSVEKMKELLLSIGSVMNGNVKFQGDLISSLRGLAESLAKGNSLKDTIFSQTKDIEQVKQDLKAIHDKISAVIPETPITAELVASSADGGSTCSRCSTEVGHQTGDKSEDELVEKMKELVLSIGSMMSVNVEFQGNLISSLRGLAESQAQSNSLRDTVLCHTKDIEQMKKDLQAIHDRSSTVTTESFEPTEVSSLRNKVLSQEEDINQMKEALKLIQESSKSVTPQSVCPKSGAELVKDIRQRKAQIEAEEVKFRPKITSSLETSTTVMALLVGFHTLIAVQPLSTGWEFWLIIGLIILILTGTLMFLYMAWYTLGSLAKQVKAFTEKHETLVTEAKAVDKKEADEAFFTDIEDGATQTREVWKAYRIFVLLMGIFAIVISVYLGVLSCVKWSNISPASSSATTDIGYSIFGRGGKSLGGPFSV